MNEEHIHEFSALLGKIRAELNKVIEGQEQALDHLLTAFIVGGHVLLEGVPGVAKTLTVRCLARALSLEFGRIQFTPDLMPADVTGVNVLLPQTGQFQLRKGPVFADILLGDEINRSPAKTQSAMLEAMQERQVTIDGVTHQLSDEFMVVATQNPLEFEGTYPLPEAQLDRFLMKVNMDYPSKESELRMLSSMNDMGSLANNPQEQIEPVLSREDIYKLRQLVHKVVADQSVLEYILNIITSSRTQATLSNGASPRAGVMLLHGAKALALTRGRGFVNPDDVRDIALPVLRHRILLTPEAQIQGSTADSCIGDLLKQVQVPR